MRFFLTLTVLLLCPANARLDVAPNNGQTWERSQLEAAAWIDRVDLSAALMKAQGLRARLEIKVTPDRKKWDAYPCGAALVCLSGRLAAEASPDEIEAVIAHEMAHMTVWMDWHLSLWAHELICDLFAVAWMEFKGRESRSMRAALLGLPSGQRGSDWTHPAVTQRTRFLVEHEPLVIEAVRKVVEVQAAESAYKAKIESLDFRLTLPTQQRGK